MKYAYLQFAINLASLIILVPLFTNFHPPEILAAYLLLTNFIAVMLAVDLAIIPIFISEGRASHQRSSGSSGYILLSLAILLLSILAIPQMTGIYLKYFGKNLFEINTLLFLSLILSITSGILNIQGSLAQAKKNESLLGVLRILGIAMLIYFGASFNTIIKFWIMCVVLNIGFNCFCFTKFVDKYDGFVAVKELQTFRNLIFRNYALSAGSILILYGSSFVVALFGDPTNAAALMLSLKVFQVAKNLAQVPITFSIHKLSQFYHEESREEFKDFLKTEHSKSIFIYGIMAFGIFLLAYVGVFNLLNIDLLHLRFLFFISLIYLLELNHGNMSQVYIITFKNPFLLGSLLSGIAILLLNYTLASSFSILGVLLVQFIVQLCWNNWFPAFVFSKHLRCRMRELFVPSFTPIILEFKKIKHKVMG